MKGNNFNCQISINNVLNGEILIKGKQYVK